MLVAPLLLGIVAASCGSSDGGPPAAANDNGESGDVLPSVLATPGDPRPTSEPAAQLVEEPSSPTVSASVVLSPILGPEPDYATVDELIDSVKARRTESDVKCLSEGDTQPLIPATGGPERPGIPPGSSREIEVDGRCVEISYQLPRDAIPAIFDPTFVSPAAAEIPDSEMVIGLSIEGDHRAYSVPVLSSHEVVNDVVGGKPVAVTW